MPVRPLAPAAQAFREEFVERALDAAATAQRTTLQIAGETVAVDVATPEIGAALLPALAHHEAPRPIPRSDGHATPTQAPARPDIRIVVWAEALPPFPWGGQHLGRGGAIAGFSDGPVRAIASFDDSSVVLWDANERLACCWFAGLHGVTRWDRAAPLRTALHFALTTPWRHLVHGAVVGRAGRGVMLAGPGGCGKSTTTLACLHAGLDIVGDDYAVVERASGRPRAWNLYRSIKVGERRGDRDDRRTLLLGADLPAQPSPSLDLQAILLPRISGGAQSTLVPSSQAAALRALAPSTLLQAPQEDRPGLGFLAELARALPALELHLGDDHGVPAIREALTA